MKKTKEKILATALKLFNQEGLANIKLRRIATEMGISQGNLNYHFKKRSDIVEGLYFQLLELMDKGMDAYIQDKITLKTLFVHSKHLINNFYDYRFFMLDFVHIMRGHPKVNEHYKTVRALRKEQFLALFHLLFERKIFRPEDFDGEWLHLHQRATIMCDFWISSAVVEEELNLKLVDKYTWILFESFYPYLTEVGKKDFLSLRDQKMSHLLP